MYIERGRIMNDFIQTNKVQYSIPVYQRNYEWTEEQCRKLFEDIVAAHKKQKPHFCGSIVYAILNTGGKILNYVVIDGQQRLTTIYILTKALMDSAQTDSEKEKISDDLFNSDKFDKYAIDTSSKLKLKPVKSDNEQLLLLMDGKINEMDESSYIWKNYNLFKTMIEEEFTKDKDMTVQKIYDGLEWLIVARIKLEDDDQPQEIFERINSTGLPLSLSDKIRNFILMVDKDQERLYEEYWLKIEKIVKDDQLDSFFYTYINFKSEVFPREDAMYEMFKSMFAKEGYTNESMLKELLHYAELYSTFLYGSDKYSNDVNKYLKSLRMLKQTTSYGFLFKVFDDRDSAIINDAELEKVLFFLQNYIIRRTICEIGSNSLRGLYKTLYSRIFSDEKNKDHYYDSVVSFFLQLNTKDSIPNDQEFSEALKYNNLYRKNALCKFLLTAIENQGKETLNTSALTIEHILPQNKNLSTSWQKMLGDDWYSVHEKYVHTLGNLTLTGYNSELGDKPLKSKKELLDDAQTKVVRLYSDVKNADVWNKDSIEARAGRLIKEIFNLFPIVKPDTVVSFADPYYKEYKCYDPSDATNKTPNYYVLSGERIMVDSFAEMLKTVVIKLYNENPEPIKDMAKDNKTLAEWSALTVFSYNSDNVKGNYKIPDTDIYQSVGFSAYYIIQIIKTLLEKYEISLEDFCYSARNNKKDDDAQTKQD